MPTPSTRYQVHTEARGPHWIAWVTRGADAKPERSVVLVAATQQEAEARAHEWARQTIAPTL
jgi:hypothetical protein